MRSLSLLRPALAAIALSLLAATVAATPATVVRNSTAHERPFVDSPTVAMLATKTRVEIIGAQGAWNQVRLSNGRTAWVRLLNLRPEAARGGSSLAGIGQLGNVARTGSTGSAATTGAKGISKEELESAEPNLAEVERLEGFRSNPAEARQYAASARLQAREVAPLPERK
ncbi:MAG TPA: SH3 domain-containing protein [Rhodocyclaceae bacterium]